MTDLPFSPASISPAAMGDLLGTVGFILTKQLQRTDDMLPAMVLAYDRSTNQASVQPLIAIVTTDNIQVQRSLVPSIPVMQTGGGGFVFSWPIKPGDLGWIKANDSDISLFKQSFANSPPNTARLHSFEDAVFIPDSMMRAVTIDPDDADAVVLQSLDGSVKISLSAGNVKINATTITLTGNVNVTGNIHATGDIVAGTISLEHHTHSGVTTGGGNTGVPNP